MADGIAITSGSGTTILTDDTGATGHAQVVKLAIATDGSATLIPADANGLTVKSGTASNMKVAATLDAETTKVIGTVNVASGQSISVSNSTGASAVNIQDGGNSITVDGAVTATLSAETTKVIGTVNVAAGQSIAVTNGTASNCKVAATLDAETTKVIGTVNIAGSQTIAVTNAGTFATQSAITAPGTATSGASTINSTSSDGGTALTSTAQAIKASQGVLVGYYIFNPNATTAFVNFYNVAQGSVTVGTTNPLFHVAVPAASAANLWMPGGVAFSTAMSWSATATAGSNTAPTTALDAVCWYV